MTQNQLAYMANLETQRANMAREVETNRSNLANERETHRANTAREYETMRHNIFAEQETSRSNKTREQETYRHNVITENDTRFHQAETRYLNYLGHALDVEKFKADVAFKNYDYVTKRMDVQESIRHNQAVEKETNRHNKWGEVNSTISTGNQVLDTVGKLAIAVAKAAK